MKTCKLITLTQNSPLREGMSSPARQGCVNPRREVHTPNPSQEGNLQTGVVGWRRVFTSSPSLLSGTPPKNRRRAFYWRLLQKRKATFRAAYQIVVWGCASSTGQWFTAPVLFAKKLVARLRSVLFCPLLSGAFRCLCRCVVLRRCCSARDMRASGGLSFYSNSSKSPASSFVFNDIEHLSLR